MKNKGFTLVELLATITILGILSGIAVVSVSRILQSAHKDSDEAIKSNVIAAAKSYYSDHKALLPIKVGYNNRESVSVSDLVEKKYIKQVSNSNKQVCNGNVYVERKDVSNYKYYVELDCID